MNLIVNTDKNGAIGRNNSLLFRLTQDMQFFKSHTMGNVIIMGRKTLESLPVGKALPNRVNIVLTTNPSFERENVIVCHNLNELFDRLKAYEDKEIYVIGGESIYKLLLPYCDTAYVTLVEAEASEADAYMIPLDTDKDWHVAKKGELLEENGLKFRFMTYKRRIG